MNKRFLFITLSLFALTINFTLHAEANPLTDFQEQVRTHLHRMVVSTKNVDLSDLPVGRHQFKHILVLDDGSEWLIIRDTPEGEIHDKFIGQQVRIDFSDDPVKIEWMGYTMTFSEQGLSIPVIPFNLPLTIRDVRPLADETIAEGNVNRSSAVILSDGSQWVVFEPLTAEAAKVPSSLIGKHVVFALYQGARIELAMIVTKDGHDAESDRPRALIVKTD